MVSLGLLKSSICICKSINYKFLSTRRSKSNRPAFSLSGLKNGGLDDNRCVWVWAQSCSIFADDLRRSSPHERTTTWLQVKRRIWLSRTRQAPVAGGLLAYISHNSNNPKPFLITLHMNTGPCPARGTAGLMVWKPRACTQRHESPPTECSCETANLNTDVSPKSSASEKFWANEPKRKKWPLSN